MGTKQKLKSLEKLKTGDLVKINVDHWKSSGKIGIIIKDLNSTFSGTSHKVLFSDGKVLTALSMHLKKLNEE